MSALVSPPYQRWGEWRGAEWSPFSQRDLCPDVNGIFADVIKTLEGIPWVSSGKGLGAFTAVAWVQSLIWKLRSCKLRACRKRKEKSLKKKTLKSILDYAGGGPKSNDKRSYKMKRGCRYKDDGGRD